MPILERFTKKYLHLIKVDPDQSCGRDTIDLVLAVEALTEALEYYSRRSSDDYLEARNILDKVWGENES